MGESEASTPDAQAATETVSEEESTVARLQARVAALEEKLKAADKPAAAAAGKSTGAAPPGLSLFNQIVVGVVVALVPAIFGLGQYVVQWQADKNAMTLELKRYEHELYKHHDKQLDDAIARFMAAETYEQRVRTLEALGALSKTERWEDLITTLSESVKREGEFLAEGGQLAPAEAKRVDDVMEQTQQQLKEAKEALEKQEAQQNALDGPMPTATTTTGGSAALSPLSPKPAPAESQDKDTIASHVRRQFVRIALTTDCEEAIKSAQGLSPKHQQYVFEVYKQKDDRCALTIGGYSLSMAQNVVAQWKAGKVKNYPQALVVSEAHFLKRHYP